MKRRGRLLPLLIAVPVLLWLISGIAPRGPSDPAGSQYQTGLDTRRWIGEFLRTKRWPSEPPSASEAAIGGPFALVDQDGRRVSEEDLHGRFMLVYFGCALCADARPLALAAMVEAAQALRREGRRIQPVFITLDPERETVERLAGYARKFGPSLVTLTGEPREIARLARFYGVPFSKACEARSPADCLIEEGVAFYLVGPAGERLARLEAGWPAEAIANKVRQYLYGLRPHRDRRRTQSLLPLQFPPLVAR